MTDTSEAMSVLLPYPADAMQVYAISKEVNTFNGQGPELIKPTTSA